MVVPSDPSNFAKTAYVELFELLDVPPVQGPALGAEQEGCEDDSTIDFHLCFQGYNLCLCGTAVIAEDNCS